jgi:hypothetical protein
MSPLNGLLHRLRRSFLLKIFIGLSITYHFYCLGIRGLECHLLFGDRTNGQDYQPLLCL